MAVRTALPASPAFPEAPWREGTAQWLPAVPSSGSRFHSRRLPSSSTARKRSTTSGNLSTIRARRSRLRRASSIARRQARGLVLRRGCLLQVSPGRSGFGSSSGGFGSSSGGFGSSSGGFGSSSGGFGSSGNGFGSSPSSSGFGNGPGSSTNQTQSSPF